MILVLKLLLKEVVLLMWSNNVTPQKQNNNKRHKGRSNSQPQGQNSIWTNQTKTNAEATSISHVNFQHDQQFKCWAHVDQTGQLVPLGLQNIMEYKYFKNKTQFETKLWNLIRAPCKN